MSPDPRQTLGRQGEQHALDHLRAAGLRPRGGATTARGSARSTSSCGTRARSSSSRSSHGERTRPGAVWDALDERKRRQVRRMARAYLPRAGRPAGRRGRYASTPSASSSTREAASCAWTTSRRRSDVRARAAGMPSTGTTSGAAARRPGAGSRRGARASSSRRARPNSQPGCSSSARRMNRSRVTLARIDAAAIAALVASPSMIAPLLVPDVGNGEPVDQAQAPGPRDALQRVAQRGEVRAVQAAAVDPARAARHDRRTRGRAQHDRDRALRASPRRAAWSR